MTAIKPRLRSIGHKLHPSFRAKVSQPIKRAEAFYLSAEWRAFIDALVIERFGRREDARCEDPECKYPERRGIRVFGDHIRERKDGGAPFDRSNILCRCGSCHTRKTAAERGRRLGLTAGG
jgi:5-methylcytosine-specific restriction protein A